MAEGQVTKLLEFGPFAGMKTTPGDFYVDPPYVSLVSGLNLRDEIGILKSEKGRTNIGAVSGAGEVINSRLHRFYRGSALVPQTIFSTSLEKVYTLTDAGVLTALTLDSALTNGAAGISGVNWGGYFFFCNGTDSAQKIASDGTVTKMGITKPSTAPSGAAGVAGSPDGTYNYRVTYQSATHESSPGPISANVTVVNQKVNLTAIPESADTQVTTVNIYRLGGDSAVWSYVGNVSNGTTTATDDVADADVGAALELNRDPPPVGCKQFIIYKNRIWGITNTTVEYSNYNEPEGWNTTTNSIPIDNSSSGDTNSAMTIIGSILLIARRQSLFGILGNNQVQFMPKRILNRGLVAPKTFVSDGKVAIGLWEDGVWAFDGVTWKNLLLPIIPSIMDDITLANRGNMSGCIFDTAYYLSSLSANRTWRLDFQTNQWDRLPWGCYDIMPATGNQDPETIIGVRNNQISVDKWFDQVDDDLGSVISFEWTTDRIIIARHHLATIREIHLYLTNTAITYTLTVTYNGDATNSRDTFTITPTTADSYFICTPSSKGANCHDIQLSITGSTVLANTNPARIFYVTLFGWIEARRRIAGA